MHREVVVYLLKDTCVDLKLIEFSSAFKTVARGVDYRRGVVPKQKVIPMEKNEINNNEVVKERVENQLSDSELREVSGGQAIQQHVSENEGSQKVSVSINRAHERRLEQIDNPELAQ